jgi:Malectin domain
MQLCTVCVIVVLLSSTKPVVLFAGKNTSVDASLLAATTIPAELYRTNSQGSVLTSSLPLKAGETYFVRLHFCETDFNTTGARLINVTLNGLPLVLDLDVLAKVGKYVSGFITLV